MQVEKAIASLPTEEEAKYAILNLMYTGYMLSDQANELLKPFGISEQQCNVLFILSKNKDASHALCNIQEKMMHKTCNATRLVEKLRLKGLVTRNIREDNRRMVEINITEKGSMLLEKINQRMCGHRQELSKKLTKDEFRQLNILLNKLRE